MLLHAGDRAEIVASGVGRAAEDEAKGDHGGSKTFHAPPNAQRLVAIQEHFIADAQHGIKKAGRVAPGFFN
jgi:hypothetical protein